MTKTTDRNLKYDIIRAVAIFFVVCGHSIGPVVDISNQQAAGFDWIKIYFTFTGAFVPVFVMLSGGLLLSRQETFSKVFKHRFKRVIIPFIFWSFIVYTSTFFYHGGHSFLQCLTGYAHDIFVGDVHEVYWFVYMILALYLATPFLCTIVQSKEKNDIYLLLFIVAVLIAGKCFPRFIPLSWWHNQISTWLLFFVVGHYIANKLQYRSWFKVASIIGFIVLWAICCYLDIMHLEEGVYDLIRIMAFISVYCLFLAIAPQKYNPTVTNGISCLSKYSYGIYLSHIMFIPLFVKLPVFKTIPLCVSPLCLAFCAVLTCLIILLILDKIGLGKISR